MEGAWRYIQNILDGWRAHPVTSVPGYAAGSWGPAEADEFLAREGRQWRRL